MARLTDPRHEGHLEKKVFVVVFVDWVNSGEGGGGR